MYFDESGFITVYLKIISARWRSQNFVDKCNELKRRDTDAYTELLDFTARRCYLEKIESNLLKISDSKPVRKYESI